MRFRAAQLAAVAVAVALAGATAAGCRRAPLARSGGQDAAPDLQSEAAPPGDGSDRAPDAVLDAAHETGDGDGGTTDGATDLATGGDAPVDSPSAADAPADSPSAADAPADLTGAADRRADMAVGDAPANDAPSDRAGADASDVRAEDQPCGPLGFHCTPFACDVPRGVCKTTCASDDDCATGWPCRAGSCGLGTHTPCSSNAECNSGFCAQGVCCQSACNQTCRSCALPGTIGTCTQVASGSLDPTGNCPAGNVCDGRGQCLPTSCTIDTDCGAARWCTNGRCAPCAATCASDADCTSNAICVMRNSCTYCALRDAGSG